MAVTPEQIALVRLYAADLGTGPDELFTDAQYTVLIDSNAGAVRLAAADALEAMAASEVLVSKKIRTQDLSTDGPAVSAELRALAQRHRDLHAAGVDAEDDGFFDIVDTLSGCRRPELTEHAYPYEAWGL